MRETTFDQAKLGSMMPATASGLTRVRRSLWSKRRATAILKQEPEWRSEYVQVAPQNRPTTLQEFGYQAPEIRRWKDRTDDVAMINTMRLLTDEGANRLAEVCRALEPWAEHNDYVVTQRLRGVEDCSRFVHGMVRDPNFLLGVSRAVGVPLIPHPFRDAAVQINYYSPTQSTNLADLRIAKWHVDGMDYVFTMLLTDASQYSGGEFIYFQGTKEEFERKEDGWITKIRKAGFSHVGDTLYAKGSHVYHAVTPVSAGKRVTIVISLFCPYLAHADSNRFWHSAPDDGFLRTARNWLRFKIPGLPPSYYYNLVSAPRVTWNDL